ncbi:MAG: YfcE family phosphodiesterase, partial [candidate division WOR-3 bacterium]
ENIKKAINVLKERNINTLIHLGDYCAPFSIPLLKIEKVYAIFGNNDGEKLFLQKKANDSGFVIDRGPKAIYIEGRKIAIMHEPYELEAFRRSGIYDIVLHGHTHEYYIKKDPLTVNPGELCGYLSGKPTFAIIDLGKLECEIVEL